MCPLSVTFWLIRSTRTLPTNKGSMRQGIGDVNIQGLYYFIIISVVTLLDNH